MTAPPAALGVDVTPEPVVPLPPPRPRPSRRAVAVVAGVVVAVLGAGTAVLALRPPPHSDEPVVLPETLLGMPVSPYDFADERDATSGLTWVEQMPYEGAVDGHGYSPGATVPLANLVVVRQDVSGDDDPGDVGMAGDVEQRFGSVSCTQQLDFSNSLAGQDDGVEQPVPARSRSGIVLVCWRADRLLTVSVIVIGIDEAAFGAADVAAAIDEVWALQG